MKHLLRAHKKLLWLALFTLVCAGLCTQLRVSENILSMIPASVRKPVELFEHSALGQKLFVVTHAASEDESRERALNVREELVSKGLVHPLFVPPASFARVLLGGLPARFSAADAAGAEQLLTPEETQNNLGVHYENLLSLQSTFLKQIIPYDPFNLISLMTGKLAALGKGTGLEFEDGLLTSADGKTQIGMYDVSGKSTDFNTAQKINDFFVSVQKQLPPGLRVFYLGSLRYTWENVQIIKRDLRVITLLALTCLSAVFVIFFRQKSALLIYALPVMVLPPAALVTGLIFGEISGITLGFGSVVAGLSLDYAVYVFFALQAAPSAPAQTLCGLKKHLFCNFMTSALCFCALFCSSVEVFRQIAVFSLCALALALFYALRIFPPYFQNATKQSLPAVTRTYVLPRAVALAVCALVLAFGWWGATRTRFSRDIAELNSTSSAFKQDKQLFDSALPVIADQQALLFVLGASQEEALMRNEILSAKLPEPLAVSGLFMSERGQTQNKRRWADFWSANRRNYARLLLEEYAPQFGFAPAAFAPFFERTLADDPLAGPLDLSVFYNPVIALTDGSYGIVNRVPDNSEYKQIADNKNVFFFSRFALQEQLMRAVKKEALQIVLLALLFNFSAVWLVFRKFKDTLVCFVPVVCGACVTFGCFALFGVRVNLFVLVFLPLLMGLGIDYGIFQVIKYKRGADRALYPPRALMAAGLSTLAGFGVLIAARHEVLFMMGFSSFVGISAAVCVSLFILPAFLERKK